MKFARVTAELSASALSQNYRAILGLTQKQEVLPMVKANAYGHGDLWAVRQLLRAPRLYGFGVATLEEGAKIREAVDRSGRKVSNLLVFSGTAPWTEEKGRFCLRYRLTPVIATNRDWNTFLKQGWPGRLPYELKFNTGMNRLGISLTLAPAVIRALRERPRGWHPLGVFSHLAVGENAKSPWSCKQRVRFLEIRQQFANAFPQARFHLSNSAAIWNREDWGLDGMTDVVRPGLSLYGVPPFEGANQHGLKSVMVLKAPVVALHHLKKGDAIGYGATYRVRSPTQIAILAAGYADGIHRALSNYGQVWLGKNLETFVGRISMDLCAVSCHSRLRTGAWAEILGPHVDYWKQASAAQTVPYELFTSISNRVERVYL